MPAAHQRAGVVADPRGRPQAPPVASISFNTVLQQRQCHSVAERESPVRLAARKALGGGLVGAGVSSDLTVHSPVRLDTALLLYQALWLPTLFC